MLCYLNEKLEQLKPLQTKLVCELNVKHFSPSYFGKKCFVESENDIIYYHIIILSYKMKHFSIYNWSLMHIVINKKWSTVTN